MSENLDDPIEAADKIMEANHLKVTSSKNVYQRAHDVMCKIGVIQKRQRNTQQSYDYRGIEDVLVHLQPLLEEAGLMILPVTESFTQASHKDKGYITTVTVNFTFVNIDDPQDRFIVPITGEGFDSLDKSTGKAYSSAYKIMCFQTFCVPTKEAQDTEKDQPGAKSNERTQPVITAQPPPPKQVDENITPLTPNGWNKIYSVMDALEIPAEQRAPVIMQTLQKLNLSAPSVMDRLPIAIGKRLVAEFEKQVESKNNFLSNPFPE